MPAPPNPPPDPPNPPPDPPNPPDPKAGRDAMFPGFGNVGLAALDKASNCQQEDGYL
ncbi:hypothetical protein GEV33_000447 [Tenebrio molitor]|uniref:Uncharacterized protein n=1 Tax=Tenebrio molitor TaxID=7067 RepID=A0A8J6HWX7_TENMO|nr:hypothetical protein GEV33_000447 [Tenebrio molitor]